jgi:hypothetical protein
MALLLEKQAIYDDRVSDRSSGEIKGWRNRKTAVIGHAVGVAIGQLFEADSRQIAKETIPDLSICRAQLILLHGLREDMCEQISRRVPGPNDGIRQAMSGRVMIDAYLAPIARENDFFPESSSREEQMSSAVESLHVATESLAHFYGVPDVGAAHLARLGQLMGPDAHLLD